ncbi:hypothetical protein HK104_000410 [Borealophlyctis nickersoniae]|nr:hypothetical protein HK104_000410 [Borealophlyctis nickersoniae]
MPLNNLDQAFAPALDALQRNPAVVILVAAGGLAMLYSALYSLYHAAYPSTNVPMYPGGEPFLGIFRELVKSAKVQANHLYFGKISKVLGPIGRARTLRYEFTLVSDPILAKEILSDTETYGRAKQLRLLFGLLGEATIIALEGPQWKKYRKVISAAFTNSHLNASIPKVNEVLDSLFPIWDAQALAGTPVEVYNDLSTLALDFLGHAVLGVDFQLLKSRMDSTIDNGKMGSAGKLLDMIMLGLQRRVGGMPPIFWRFVGDKLGDTIKELRDIIESIMDAKAEQLRLSDKRQGDLLESMLLQAEAGVSKKDIIDNMVLLFIAGEDTSANTMVWTLLLLAQNPDKKKKLQDEIESVLGNDGVPKTSVDINSLKYLDAVIKESMRLYGPAPLSQRRSKKPALLGDKWQIPADHDIVINWRFMHLDEKYWPEPLEFRPERWFDETAKTNPAYMPFGAGPFMCPGMRFANLSMRMSLARIVQRYDFTLVPGQSLTEVFTVTLGLKQGLKLDMKRR